MLVGPASTNQSTKCCSVHFQTSPWGSWLARKNKAVIMFHGRYGGSWQVLEGRVQLLALQPHALPPSGTTARAEWPPCIFYVHGPCFSNLLPASVCACLFCSLRRHTCNRPWIIRPPLSPSHSLLSFEALRGSRLPPARFPCASL